MLLNTYRKQQAFITALLIVIALLLGREAAAQTGLQVSFGSSGLQTLTYRNVVLENLATYPSDAFHIWHMKATDLSGNVLSTGQYGWGENNNGSSWDESTHTWTYLFTWGSISVQYVQDGDNLNMVVTTVNNAGSGIIFDGATIYPLVLNFPQLPAGFIGTNYNWFADNTSAPSVTTADYGSGEVSAMVPDASAALYSGFQATGNGFGYTAIISGTSPDSLAAFAPHNDRPVQPGATDTYTVSLRFAASGVAAATLAPDVYTSWAATYPPVLQWNDRRAIGTVFLASSPTGDASQPGGYPNNPRRYFNDSNASDFDVTTAAGLAAFQTRMLAQAQTNVTDLKLLNAQGAITWDIEGEQYPQDTSYVCSPDQIATVAPEMESVITDSTSPYKGMKLDDAYFKTMTDAGLRVGVCVRPQQFTINPDGSAGQTYLADSTVAAQLIRKMKYAHDRWAVTLFYIDSSVNALGGTLDASIFQQAAAGLPDSLLIPEETTARDYAYTAPFKSFLFHGDLGTDATVYNYYPNAFSANLINDVNPSTLAAAQAQLTQQVKQGDVLMGIVDFWQANDPTIVQIYQDAGVWTNPGASSTKATSLTIAAAANSVAFGANVSLSATLLPATATGAVTFYDGSTVLGTAATNSGAASFATSGLAVGTHTLTAVYGGVAGYTGSSSGAVTVTVTAQSTTTTLAASSTSLTLGTSVTLTASVSGGAAGSVTFYDGTVALGAGTLSGGLTTYSTSALTAGPHALTAAYAGASGFATSTSAPLTVTVSGPVTTAISLTLSSTSVTAGANVILTAQISPLAATGPVTFYDGGTALGMGTATSGVASFATSGLTAGPHNLTAVYGGATGYASSTAAVVVVTVAAAAVQTSTTLSASTAQLTAGTSVTLAARVTPMAASGMVTFYDGGTALGTGTATSGAAGFATSGLTVGLHNLTAVYGGTTGYSSSTSAAVLVTVTAAVTAAIQTSTVLSASTPQPSAGASVTLTARVTPAASGTVTFYDSGTALGAAPANSGAASFAINQLTAGTHMLTAVYGGAAGYASSASVAVAVIAAATSAVVPTSTILSASTSQPAVGASVTFTAIVAPVVAGTVTFEDGEVVLGTGTLSGGVATYATSTLSAGTHSVTAVYGGSSTGASSSSEPVTIFVAAAKLAVSVSLPNLTIEAGHHAPIQISVATFDGLTDTVVLSCGNLPAFASCSFAPASLIASGSASSQMSSSLMIDTDAVQNFMSDNRRTQPAVPLSQRMLRNAMLALLYPAMIGGFAFRRRKLPRALLTVLISISAALALGGCGSQYPEQTAPGTYAITVTGRAVNANVTSTATLTLVVTP